MLNNLKNGLTNTLSQSANEAISKYAPDNLRPHLN